MYLFSSVVSMTAIPWTMTTSEGDSEENMLSNSRCIISSLMGEGRRGRKRWKGEEGVEGEGGGGRRD